MQTVFGPYLLRACIVGSQEAAHASAGGLGTGVGGGGCIVEVTRLAHIAGAEHPVRISG